MKKAAVALLCTVSLSGCALPVGVTVASWAADGVSLLATEKSLLDHGISYVSGQDCALWRVFTEDDVCSDETETGMALASADGGLIHGYVDAGVSPSRELDDYLSLAGASSVEVASNEPRVSYAAGLGEPWYRQNRNDEYLSLMPESFMDGVGEKTVRLADAKPASSAASSTLASLSALPNMPAEPVMPVVVAEVAEIPSGLSAAPAIDIEFATDTEQFEPPVATERPIVVAEANVDGGVSAAPGRYFVIGSFGVWNNAVRFAERHEDLAAHIHGATVNGAEVYRIVVGPYLPAESDALKSAIAEAGIAQTWSVNVDAGSQVAAWYPGLDRELASLVAASES